MYSPTWLILERFEEAKNDVAKVAVAVLVCAAPCLKQMIGPRAEVRVVPRRTFAERVGLALYNNNENAATYHVPPA